MVIIDFSRFPIFVDIEHSSTQEVDVRKGVSNRIYTSLAGLPAHELALRIFRSKGPIEMSDEDIEILELFANSEGTPAFQDSLKEYINQNQK